MATQLNSVAGAVSSHRRDRVDAAPTRKRRDWSWRQQVLSTSPLEAGAAAVIFLLARPCLSSSASGEDGAKPQFQVLEDLFPDLDVLARAWERRPLLCTAHRGRISSVGKEGECAAVDEESCASRTETRSSVPISFDWSSSSSSSDVTETEEDSVQRRTNRIHSSMFSPSNIDSFLSPSSLSKFSHGTDYNVVKKVLDTDGITERRGMLPGENLSAEKIRRAIEQVGYSVVVNSVHRKHDKVERFTEYLMKDVGAGTTSANLYMTPAADRRSSGGENRWDSTEWEPKHAFETHWDWMDVIVVQISGTKLWSVASQPVVFLSHSDQVRKLSTGELRTYAATRYSDFLMQPGDTLYIPRGFPHNASTISAGMLSHLTSSANAYGATSPPSLTSEPSVHLTVGIETYCDTTLETLLHRTLDQYTQHFPNRDSIAIAGEACGARPDQVVKWDAVLHAAIAEMSRREDSLCVTGGSDGMCAMRKSIALNPAWRKMLSHTSTRKGEKIDCVDAKGNNVTDGLLCSYLSAVDALSEGADLRRLAMFVGNVQTPHEGSSSHSLFVCLPTVLPAIHILLCPPPAIAAANRDQFAVFLRGFVEYAKTKVGRRAGMKELEEKLKSKRSSRRSG